MEWGYAVTLTFPYACRYKGISVCFQILTRCLGGKYVNFGVLWLYQDQSVDQAFRFMFQLMMAIPTDDIMVKQKNHKCL